MDDRDSEGSSIPVFSPLGCDANDVVNLVSFLQNYQQIMPHYLDTALRYVSAKRPPTHSALIGFSIKADHHSNNGIFDRH